LSTFARWVVRITVGARCKISDRVWSPENSAHMCVMLRVTDIYVLTAHCCGGCVQDAFGRAELLFSVDQACIQSASHRLVTVVAVTSKQMSNLL
jgi:hypothetical protein